MLHHLSFAVADLARSAAFYDAALDSLGYVRAWTHESGTGYKEAAVGYGPQTIPRPACKWTRADYTPPVLFRHPFALLLPA